MWRRNIFSSRATRILAATRSRRRTTSSTPSTISGSLPPRRRPRRMAQGGQPRPAGEGDVDDLDDDDYQRAVGSVRLASRACGGVGPAAAGRLSEPAGRPERAAALSRTAGFRPRAAGPERSGRISAAPGPDQTIAFQTAAHARTGSLAIAPTDIETIARIAMAGRAISARIGSPVRNRSQCARARPNRSAPRRCRRS